MLYTWSVYVLPFWFLVDRENENHEFVAGKWRNITGAGVLHNITRLGYNNPSRSA